MCNTMWCLCRAELCCLSITNLPKTSDVVLWTCKLIVKQLCCLVCPGLWLNEAHRKPVSCMNGSRRGRYRFLKQLPIYSRRHPSDKMIKRSAFQTMTPIGQQRCRVWALVWLHLSGRISAEKSLPTLGRKISKGNHPSPPPVLVWTMQMGFPTSSRRKHCKAFPYCWAAIHFPDLFQQKQKAVRIKFGKSGLFFFSL